MVKVIYFILGNICTPQQVATAAACIHASIHAWLCLTVGKHGKLYSTFRIHPPGGGNLAAAAISR